MTDAGKSFHVSRPALASVLNVKTGLIGNMMDTLMRMQNSFGIAQTPNRKKKIHAEPYEPHVPA